MCDRIMDTMMEKISITHSKFHRMMRIAYILHRNWNLKEKFTPILFRKRKKKKLRQRKSSQLTTPSENLKNKNNSASINNMLLYFQSYHINNPTFK